MCSLSTAALLLLPDVFRVDMAVTIMGGLAFGLILTMISVLYPIAILLRSQDATPSFRGSS